jgi:hypothetical protein
LRPEDWNQAIFMTCHMSTPHRLIARILFGSFHYNAFIIKTPVLDLSLCDPHAYDRAGRNTPLLAHLF